MAFYGLGPRSYEVGEPFYGQRKPFYGLGKTFYGPGKSSYRPVLRLFPNKTAILAAGSMKSPFGPAISAELRNTNVIAERCHDGSRGRQSLSLPTNSEVHSSSTNGARHTSLGQRPRSAMSPRCGGLKARFIQRAPGCLGRAYSPLHSLPQEPGPLAQAGMSTGLWP